MTNKKKGKKIKESVLLLRPSEDLSLFRYLFVVLFFRSEIERVSLMACKKEKKRLSRERKVNSTDDDDDDDDD